MNTMRKDWPWPAMARQVDVEVQTNGHSSTLFSDDEVRALAALLMASLPDAYLDRVTMEHVGPHQSCCSAYLGQYGISQTFTRAGDRIEVAYDGFFLPEQFRNSGIALQTLRQSLIAYDRIGANAVQFQAVHDGAYTWAYWGGIVLHPQDMRADLVSETTLNSLSHLGRNLLEHVVNEAGDDLLMYDLARLRTESGANLGRKLLTSRSWVGFVDLDCADQRSRIADALSERT